MSATPPPIHQRTTTAAILAVVVALALCGIYFFIDPAQPWMPRCAFHALTGYDCPGCGFQRALHAALHGHVSEAWAFNPFVFFAVPAGVFYLILETWRSRWPRFHAAMVAPPILIFILLATIAFWIGRNL